MQPQANVAVPQSVTTQPQAQQIVGVPANAVILKMSDLQQISTVGKSLERFNIELVNIKYYVLSGNLQNLQIGAYIVWYVMLE